MVFRSFPFFLAGCVLALATPSFAQIAINPQVGLSASRLSTDPPDTEDQARLGYQIGATLRIGGRLHLMPGLFWQRSGTRLKTVDAAEINEFTSQTDLDAIYASLGLGYNLIDESLLTLRVHGSAAATSIYEVNSDDSRLSRDNFKTILFGVPIGVGVDLFGFLTADLSYEFGVTDLFEDYLGIPIDATNNVFRVNVGVVF